MQLKVYFVDFFVVKSWVLALFVNGLHYH